MFVFNKRCILIFSAFLVIVLTLSTILIAINGRAQNAELQTNFKVVIDAGHGGIDGGVVGKTTGVYESEINLAISKLLAVELNELGFSTVLTRSSSAGLYGTATSSRKKKDMQKRKEIILKERPHAVLSIHQNFYPSSSRRGAQAFYNADSDASKNLAQTIQKGLNELPTNVREYTSLKGDYFLLNCCDAPSVIIECGFLSNPDDESYLTDENYQQTFAKQVAHSVAEYFLTVTNTK